MAKKITVVYEGKNDEFYKRISFNGSDCDPRAALIVPETHYAIIVRDGTMESTLDSGKWQIFEVKKGLFGIPKKIENTLIDIIFVSRTYELAVKWGTPNKHTYTDPTTGKSFKLGMSVEFRVTVQNPRQFCLKLIGQSKDYNVQALKDDLSMQLCGRISDVLLGMIERDNIPADRIASSERKLCAEARPVLNEWLEDDYGLRMISFDICGFAIDTDKTESSEKPFASAASDKAAPEKKSYCPICGRENKAGDSFCPDCGTKLK